ncbi:unnamed protein product [Linum tenue]|uniref:TIR domain-containing protein n=1 Tax=Linum tenue TaxID=586396 RepID=A0AAV0K6G9_9ROSI|nr:unnamed protein product [Linum tenue]
MGCFYVEMDYMKWAVTVIGLLPPLLIILYKLWLGRRISNRANNVDNASRTLDSIASASGSADSDTLLPLPFGEYEVFLNFRGPDTRYQITDILFRFLVNLKIRTFKDDDELRKGEGIWPNLVEAIEQSKIYVTIFSENYAYSKWCLKELAVIVERQERNQGCIILPIFYMVDPRDVRHQSGPYLRAFRQHENFFDEETIRIWKAALNKVGALKGWHVKSNDEQGAIADLVTGLVWSHLSKNNVLETDKLIGMDDHIEVVKERLALDSSCMTIVGIHGIGGIGKTTIAKAVYNKVSPQFDRCSFVEDVREMLQQRDGIIILQKHIISDILRVKNFAESIANNSAGIRIIKDRVSRFKFLIVLDDVDEKFRFDKILGNIKNFVSGSRFIITSRNVKVLSTLTDDCKDQLRDMGREIVRQESIRHPWQRSRIWSKKTTLDMLRNKKETNRVEGIRTSYEGDGEGLEKECFMNLSELRYFDIIATVLSVDFSSYLLNLRWLRLKIGYGGFMPKFCVENLGILELLSPVKDGWKGLKHIKMASKLKVLKLSGEFLIEYPQFPHSRSLEVLYLENFGPQSSHEDLDIGNLLNLKVLLLRYCEVRSITGGTIGMMKGLRELNITDLRFQKNLREALADIGELQFLEILIVELRNENLMLDTKLPPSLKVLVTPFPIANLPELLELEKLTVNECELKIPLADSSNMWWKISKLKHLKLYRTKITIPINTSLPLLPSSLTTLHIDSCSELECFPSLKNLENLTDLSIECCPILKEIHGLGGLKSLRTLSIVQTACNLDGLESLHSLTSLKLTGCDALERLPSMASLSKLLDLDISFCDSLTEIQGNVDGFESLYSLKSLTLRCCDALERLPSMGSLSKLLNLYISNCHGLTEIQGLESMEGLVRLHLYDLASIRILPSLSKLGNLERLTVKNAPNLQEIEGLGGLKSLKELHLIRCTSLESVPADELYGLERLESLDIRGCTNLKNRSSLRKLEPTVKIQWPNSGHTVRGV